MRWICALLALMLLFGCNGGEENGATKPNVTQPGKNQTVTIIVGPQQNQTIEQNYTEPVVTDNQTNVTEPSTDLEYEYAPEENLGIYFIYTGTSAMHGEAILIKKGDFDMLIDAGPQQDGRVADFLRSREVDDIEVLVSTSADKRRSGGLERIDSLFEIEHFWWTGDDFGDLPYADAVASIEQGAKLTRKVEKGYTEEFNGISFEVLNPPKTRFNDINNDAMVIRVTERNFSMLITSNIQKGAQDKLVNEQPSKTKVDVMSAPYYGVGSGTSGIGIFLITAEPDHMVISGSSDDSPENGGSREPFIRLMDQYGIEYYENYKGGTVRISNDGLNYSVGYVPSGS